MTASGLQHQRICVFSTAYAKWLRRGMSDESAAGKKVYYTTTTTLQLQLHCLLSLGLLHGLMDSLMDSYGNWFERARAIDIMP
jgi:hypothetical protein